MGEKSSTGLSISFSALVVIAVGILNAYSCGCVPWYVGAALAIIVDIMAYLGIIPILGQVLYWILAHKLFAAVHATGLTWLFWLGLAQTVFISLIAILVILGVIIP